MSEHEDLLAAWNAWKPWAFPYSETGICNMCGEIGGHGSVDEGQRTERPCLVGAFAAALEQLNEYDQSFALYDDACRRGAKMWQEATGRAHVAPDTAELVAYLMERLEAFEAQFRSVGITPYLDRMRTLQTRIENLERALQGAYLDGFRAGRTATLEATD